MIFSKDLKVRESVDYSSEIYPSLVILSLRRGCLHFCEIQISNILCVFAAFSLSYPTVGIMRCYSKNNLNPRKLKFHFLAWKLRAASLRSMRGIN